MMLKTKKKITKTFTHYRDYTSVRSCQTTCLCVRNVRPQQEQDEVTPTPQNIENVAMTKKVPGAEYELCRCYKIPNQTPKLHVMEQSGLCCKK